MASQLHGEAAGSVPVHAAPHPAPLQGPPIAPSRAVAVLCRECGAPLALGRGVEQLECDHCRSTTPVAADARRRLVRTWARALRAEQKARAALREELIARLLPGMKRQALMRVFLGLGVMVAGFFVMMLGMGFFVVAEGLEDPRLAMIAGVLVIGLGLVMCTVGFPLGIYLAWKIGKRADLEATAGAERVTELADSYADVTCNHCGGRARVSTLGTGNASPCPWCGAHLQVECQDAANFAVSALVKARQQSADAVLARARLEAGLEAQSKVQLQLEGYVRTGGVYEAQAPGVRRWISYEMVEQGLERTIEVEADCELDGQLWVVPHALAQRHAERMLAKHLVAPARQVQPRDQALAAMAQVFADEPVRADELLALPSVVAVVSTLGSEEALHIDPAGARLWRCSRDSTQQLHARAHQLQQLVSTLSRRH